MSMPSNQVVPPPQTPKPPTHKSPGLAVFFSLLPGLGHIYLGLYSRGIGFFAAFFSALWLAEHADLSGAIIAFVFFFAMFDAHRMAVLLGNTPFLEASGAAAISAGGMKKGNFTLGIVLLAAGTLLLYSNFYPLDLSFLADWWPLSLILFGLWLLVQDLKNKGNKAQTPDQSRP